MMPVPRPVKRAMNRLRILQVRIHARRFVDEPRAQMPRGVVRVFAVARQNVHAAASAGTIRLSRISACRWSLKLSGFAHAVALDIRAIGILRIGPPVIAFGEIIVLAAGAARRTRGSHRDGRLVQIFRRATQYARPFLRGEIEGIGAEQRMRRESRRRLLKGIGGALSDDIALSIGGFRAHRQSGERFGRAGM